MSHTSFNTNMHQNSTFSGSRSCPLRNNEHLPATGKSWINQIKEKLPTLESYHVTYDTKVHQANKLMKRGGVEECKVVTDPRFSKCPLALQGFPTEVYDTNWDLIVVDAPTWYHDEAPRRMTAIYIAGLMARSKEEGETDVFVHDVDPGGLWDPILLTWKMVGLTGGRV